MVVRTGLDVFLEAHMALVANRRVGLVTHPAAVTADFTHSTDALLFAGVDIQCLFGLEHGYLGDRKATEAVDEQVDACTGLPVYSLYKRDAEYDQSMLVDLDVIIFDIQDVGARYYTYLGSLYSLLELAGETGIKVLVFDRPNPLNGVHIEGPILKAGYESEVGVAHIPIRHGMTIGELALYFAQNLGMDLDLQVIPMQGWCRSMWFDDTGLAWVPPSPNLPHLSSTLLYPGTCLLEGTNLSEGRGTTLPFEVFGAPWLKNHELVKQLDETGIPGVQFRVMYFVPTSGKYKHEDCHGVQIHVTDRSVFQPLATIARLLSLCQALHETEFKILPERRAGGRPLFDELVGSSELREILGHPEALEALLDTWDENCASFSDAISSMLMYGGIRYDH